MLLNFILVVEGLVSAQISARLQSFDSEGYISLL